MASGTALGVARQRFVEALPERARELRGALALVTAAPDADRPRDELRRRLHTLQASAQVLRLTMLSNALEERLRELDRTKRERTAVDPGELESLSNLIAVLPTLGRRTESQVGPLPTGPQPESSRPPRKRRDTSREFRSLSPVQAVEAPTIGGALFVLVVGDAPSAELVREALGGDHEVALAQGRDEAMRIARRRGPDLILIDRGEAVRNDLVTRLRADRMSADTPMALLYDRGDAMDGTALRELGADAQMERSAQTLPSRLAAFIGASEGPSLDRIGESTLDDLAERLAEEMRRGIAGAVAGRSLRLDLGDGGDLLAAAWNAVAEVRDALRERVGDRVRYRDDNGPAFVQLESSAGTIAAPPAEVSLEGCKVVVADDDPAIVWFFSNLLGEAGAKVFEADDGEEALALIRAHRPHLVFTDVIMPRLDGLALCRSMADDPVLSGIPVVLLSWKADFLERTKELRNAASGFLRKEAESTRILERAEDLLVPRKRLASALDSGGPASGRVEGVGTYTAIEMLRARHPDARLEVRDGHSLFEAAFIGGVLVDVSRTAEDGSFRRGAAALRQLLGVRRGRYTVEVGAPSRTSSRSPEGDPLARAARELRATVAVVRSDDLASAEAVLFDDDFVTPMLDELAKDEAAAIRQLRSGQATRNVHAEYGDGMRSGLVELAARGAIVAIRGAGGEDLIAKAVRALEDEPIPAPEQVRSEREQDAEEPSEPAEVLSALPQDEANESTAPADAPPAEESDEATGAEDGGAVDEKAEALEAADEPPPAAAEPAGDAEASGDAEPEPEGNAEAEPEPPAFQLITNEKLSTKESALDAPLAPAPDEGDDTWGAGKWLAALFLCFAVGFGIYLSQRNTRETPADDAPSEAPSTPAPAPNEQADVVPEPEPEPEPPTSALSFGRLEAVPDDVQLAPGEGLLELPGEGERLRLGGDSPRELGTAPVRTALPEGEYEVLIESDEGTQLRYIFVREGMNRVLAAD